MWHGGHSFSADHENAPPAALYQSICQSEAAYDVSAPDRTISISTNDGKLTEQEIIEGD
jgi:hypothetical protein